MNTFILLILVYYYTFKKNQENFLELSSEEAKLKIKNNKINTILDVRTKKEFSEGYHPKAINIPIEPKNKLNKDNILNLKEPILIYCRSGRRAKNAAKLIKKYKEKVYIFNQTYKSLK